MLKLKVYAYITHKDRLLVFRHMREDAGIQVPGGSLERGEQPSAGVLREAREETGLQDLQLVRVLGETEADMRPWGVNETHHRWYFHLRCLSEPPEVWRHWETDASDGTPPHEFEFWWTPITAVPVLTAGMDEMIPRMLDTAR